ncbi:hypothetical protein SCLCIDRAFT_29720 [Scleroderma citrinum Foug A]|uniref:DUF659 domain-containing protein n=1 Tax=Scleroderma citrinum Foug A TaxID=1036808 RepID=A0A0C3DIX1_9AGAM|nr:hypothetical protein SCLCIDRAFT_29720 [Scleroderma citrinum Foug A]
MPMGELLKRLQTVLTHLPSNIPRQAVKYHFKDWAPDPEEVETYGTSEAALNHALEVAFAPGGRKDATAPYPFKFEEQGPGLVAVVDALRMELDKFPGSAVLQKWVHDLWRTTVYHYESVNLPIPEPTGGENSDVIENTMDDDIGITGSPADGNAVPVQPGAYVDVSEPAVRGHGGHPGDHRLLELAIQCYRTNDPNKTTIFHCAGTSSGCTTTWQTKNRVKQRILTHAVSCEHLPHTLKEDLDGGLAKSAPSARLQLTNVAVVPKKGPTCEERATTKSNMTQPSVYPLAKKARADKLTAQLDADIVQFFCIGGLAPSKANLPEWKQIFWHAVPSYQPASSSKLEEYHIPSEVAHVRTKQLEYLRTCTNLCITFDGQKIRLPQSVYTIHIISPERRICFFDGHEASEDSHTGKHLFQMLDEIILQVGPQRFAVICSDNTGNVRVARKEVQKKYPWIINIPDPCHHLNLLVKDLCAIDFFQPAIKITRRTKYNISHSLVPIGETQFGTVYFAAASVQRCLTPIRDLCEEKIITIPDVNESFIPDTLETLSFQGKLQQLLAVIGPPAKATKCLESSFATAADVFEFWLAVQATFEELLKKNAVGLPTHVLEKIRRLCNYRFDQIINSAPSDIWITTFFLIPTNRDSAILKNINPLSITPIQIHRTASGLSATSTADSNKTLSRIGAFLVSQLRAEYESKKEKINGLKAAMALEKLRDQIITYAKGLWPFNRATVDRNNVAKYWRDLQHHEGADVLAFFATKLFDITVNSMADERTASTMSWLNSALRNAQKSATLINQVQVRQWALMNPDHYKEPPTRVTVKFRDLNPTLLDAEINDNNKRKAPVSDNSDDIDPGEKEMELDESWLDEGSSNVEHDELFQRCDERVLAGSEVADLGSYRLLDLLSDKPIIGCSGTPSEQEIMVVPSSDAPLCWEFTLL